MLPPSRDRQAFPGAYAALDALDEAAVRESNAAASSVGWAVDAMPDDLSEGARKLVGVARALSGHPRLLCLDEPAAGLDARESEELGRALRGLADRGQTTLLIDHDMGLVLGICDRVVVLEFGCVIADGPPGIVRRDERVIAAYLGGGGEPAAATVDATPVASEAESSTGGSHESP